MIKLKKNDSNFFFVNRMEIEEEGSQLPFIFFFKAICMSITVLHHNSYNHIKYLENNQTLYF